MAMSSSFSNMNAHFHYLGNARPHNPTARLSQYATANPVLGHGMRMRSKSLHTRRIAIWALYNKSGKGDSSNRPQQEEHNEKPYRISCTGWKADPEELDVLNLLEPLPKHSYPLQRSKSKLAMELWNKINIIQEERRPYLIYLLKAKHISTMWEIAEMHYNDTSTDTDSVAAILERKLIFPEFWRGKISGGDRLFPLKGKFKMAFFVDKNVDGVYGRVLLGKFLMRKISDKFAPLYFAVRKPNGVPMNVKPCKLAFEFEEGQLQLSDLPENFPKPAKHPWPFKDQVVYMRSAGPNVLVGQALQKDREHEKAPPKLWGMIVLIKDKNIAAAR